jgi:hypothetical protein
VGREGPRDSGGHAVEAALSMSCSGTGDARDAALEPSDGLLAGGFPDVAGGWSLSDTPVSDAGRCEWPRAVELRPTRRARATSASSMRQADRQIAKKRRRRTATRRHGAWRRVRGGVRYAYIRLPERASPCSAAGGMVVLRVKTTPRILCCSSSAGRGWRLSGCGAGRCVLPVSRTSEVEVGG